MSIEILRRATADTDYTIAYIDGRPAAISEKRSGGGHYAFVEDREYIYNQSARQCWYVKPPGRVQVLDRASLRRAGYRKR